MSRTLSFNRFLEPHANIYVAQALRYKYPYYPDTRVSHLSHMTRIMVSCLQEQIYKYCAGLEIVIQANDGYSDILLTMWY